MAYFLPNTDGELATWSVNFAILIGSNPTAYGLTALQVTGYDALRTDYTVFYQRAKDPETRTKGNIVAKNEARELLKASTRALAKIIEAAPNVTNVQKTNLGLNVRKPRTPIPPPSVRPGVDMVSAIGRTVSIHIHDNASSSKRGKPAGARAAWIYTYVGVEYPSDPLDWRFEGSTTKAKYDIEFPSTLPGGTQVWVCAAWVNPKDETGPVSVPISTNLQGGGASAPANLKIAA